MSWYAKSFGWDFVLLLALSSALGFVVCDGFYVDPVLQYNLIYVIGLSAIVLLPLYFAAKSRKTLIPGIILSIVIYAIILAVSWELSVVESVIEDTEGNIVIFSLAIIITSLAAFCLSRFFIGSIVLFALGTFVISYLQFMYLFGHTIAATIFVLCSVIMVCFRYYHQTLARADTEHISFGKAFIASGLFSLVACGLGLLVVIAVLVFIDPPVMELKLVQERFALEVVQQHGIADDTNLTNEDIQSSNVNDQTQYADSDEPETEEDSPPDQEQDATNDEQNRRNTGASISYAMNAMGSEFTRITYGLAWWQIALIVLSVIVLLLAPYIVRKLTRFLWAKKAFSQDNAHQVVSLYCFCLGRFEKMGLGKPATVTPNDFARNSTTDLAVFSVDTDGITFEDVTKWYAKAAYGRQDPGRQASEGCRKFYNKFYRNCRRHMGSIKYFFKLYRL